GAPMCAPASRAQRSTRSAARSRRPPCGPLRVMRLHVTRHSRPQHRKLRDGLRFLHQRRTAHGAAHGTAHGWLQVARSCSVPGAHSDRGGDMATHRIRFGIQTGQQGIAWADMLELWQKADAWGYDSLWNFDHFYPIFVDPEGPCFEGWTTLAALAQA